MQKWINGPVTLAAGKYFQFHKSEESLHKTTTIYYPFIYWIIWKVTVYNAKKTIK